MTISKQLILNEFTTLLWFWICYSHFHSRTEAEKSSIICQILCNIAEPRTRTRPTGFNSGSFLEPTKQNLSWGNTHTLGRISANSQDCLSVHREKQFAHFHTGLCKPPHTLLLLPLCVGIYNRTKRGKITEVEAGKETDSINTFFHTLAVFSSLVDELSSS